MSYKQSVTDVASKWLCLEQIKYSIGIKSRMGIGHC